MSSTDFVGPPDAPDTPIDNGAPVNTSNLDQPDVVLPDNADLASHINPSQFVTDPLLAESIAAPPPDTSTTPVVWDTDNNQTAAILAIMKAFPTSS